MRTFSRLLVAAVIVAMPLSAAAAPDKIREDFSIGLPTCDGDWVVATGTLTIAAGERSDVKFHGTGVGTSGAEYIVHTRDTFFTQSNDNGVEVSHFSSTIDLIGKGQTTDSHFLFTSRKTINANGDVTVDYFQEPFCK